MAQQAILAANRRRRNASSAAVNLGAGGAGEERDTTASLRLGLKAKAGMLYRLFSIWDENGDGAIDDMEFKLSTDVSET